MINYTVIKNISHFIHVAMATQFDLFLVHERKDYAQKAAWEAIKEIDKLENELSRFKPNSDISRINNLKKGERIVLSEDTFNCISRSMELHKLTSGAFNIACGALLNCWLNPDYTLKNPSSEEIEVAIIKSRIENIVLYPGDFSIEILEEGTIIDLGAFGKGYTIDIISEILREWGITCALLSAGRSSIKAIGNPPELPGWQISISNPCNANQLLKTYWFKDTSAGTSGLSRGNHIINTITGKPEVKRGGSWVFCENTANSDALSTAFMILENEIIKEMIAKDDSISSLIVERKELLNQEEVNEFGRTPSQSNIC